jgi:hypothetical protein
VLFNGCGFSVYHLSKEWPLAATVLNLFLPLCRAASTGGYWASYFPRFMWD